MTQATDFDTAVSNAIEALDAAEAALEQVKSIKDEIQSAAIASGLNNPDGSATTGKQAALDFEVAVQYRVDNIGSIIMHVKDARRMLTLHPKGT